MSLFPNNGDKENLEVVLIRHRRGPLRVGGIVKKRVRSESQAASKDWSKPHRVPDLGAELAGTLLLLVPLQARGTAHDGRVVRAGDAGQVQQLHRVQGLTIERKVAGGARVNLHSHTHKNKSGEVGPSSWRHVTRAGSLFVDVARRTVCASKYPTMSSCSVLGCTRSSRTSKNEHFMGKRDISRNFYC